MLRYMLDTDISSYVMKRTSASLRDRLQHTPVAEVCISVITKSELLFGVEVSPRKAKDMAALNEYLRYVKVLDFPDGASPTYAHVRADLSQSGNMIGANDLFIAAHAKYLGLTLVTNNEREFRRVSGLKIENWSKP